MRLYFIRHAQSFNNALWERTGGSIGRSEDPELTELGLKQAKKLAKQFTNAANGQEKLDYDAWKQGELRLTHLYTSLMVRAVQTGVEIARYAKLNLTAWLDIHERGGIFFEDPETGMRIGQASKERSFFETSYPELILPPDMKEGAWWDRPYESVDEYMARAQRVIDTLINRHEKHDRVAIISHGGFYNVFLWTLFQVSKPEAVWFGLNNCGITRIDFEEGGVSLVYANRLDFMPADLIS